MKTRILLTTLIFTTFYSNAQIKVFSGGKVTVGSTYNPAYKGVNHLIVGSKTAFSDNTSFSNCAMIRGNHDVSTATTPDYTFWGDDATGMFRPALHTLAFSINGYERLRISSTGNVGIGTNSPSKRLDVNGGVRFRSGYGNMLVDNSGYLGIITITPETDWYGNIGSENKKWATIWDQHIHYDMLTDYSDLQIKENIQPLEGALEKIKLLDGKTFDIKSEYYSNAGSDLISNTESIYQNKIGLIAQELQEVYPQLVFENEGGLLSVNYIGLIPVLVEAIKELELQISDLKTELDYCCSGETNDNLKSGQIEGGNLGQEQTDCQSYLSQNRPNPFNTETIIDYYVCEQDYNAQIMVFDMTGKLLKTHQAQPGKQNLIINSGDFTPGMYYYSLVIAGNEIETKKMILSK